MTLDQLINAIDAMSSAANGDEDLLPGLIEVDSEDWCATFHQMERVAKTLDEGIRHRGVKVVVSSTFATRVLTRAEAGERGQPYRALAPAG
ncbi:hypothetical protein [Brevundimonas sp.]|uniref:hypothetical protein n=1 Tax=Brevundimonas sp. TaxID=1871086 RepID=UPI000E812924|nr:hypothetical protein [Brevundimonas sp.]HBY44328.1 hypothetical protein [Brevundimonas sp.]